MNASASPEPLTVAEFRRLSDESQPGWTAVDCVLCSALRQMLAMFEWLRRLFEEVPMKPVEAIALQPPNEVFPWPQGTVLTALDEAIIEVPMALFGNDEPIGTVVFGPDNMQLNIPLEGDSADIRFQPGMSVCLSKSCQGRVVADDKRPRKFKLSGPQVSDRPSR